MYISVTHKQTTVMMSSRLKSTGAGGRTATGSSEGLVRGGGDHVRRLEGVRHHACRHQAAATSTNPLVRRMYVQPF